MSMEIVAGPNLLRAVGVDALAMAAQSVDLAKAAAKPGSHGVFELQAVEGGKDTFYIKAYFHNDGRKIGVGTREDMEEAGYGDICDLSDQKKRDGEVEKEIDAKFITPVPVENVAGIKYEDCSFGPELVSLMLPINAFEVMSEAMPDKFRPGTCFAAYANFVALKEGVAPRPKLTVYFLHLGGKVLAGTRDDITSLGAGEVCDQCDIVLEKRKKQSQEAVNGN